MKKIITWILLLAMVVGLFAGCKKKDPTTTVDGPTVAQAMEYVKALYPKEKEAKKTPVDYDRMSMVRISNVPFTVVWTVDVSEDLIKVVDNGDGTVTIDVNEQCEVDTPYTLTATITDANGEKATNSWNYILPEAADMGEILKAAYALKDGESLPYESTLTGVVTVVKSPYDPSYKNITVIIEIAGYEDMPIECYRMKGEGIEEIAIGDTITVTGTLKNYKGTIEFDAGCICENIIPGERVQAPDDMKEIVDQAYKLGANKSLPYEAVLTGVVTEIGTPYDPSYKNITVTIAVEGRENKPIVCYRLKGTNADKIGVNDIITVRGYITNYVGSKGHSTIEYTAGCQLVDWVDKPGPVIPDTMQEIVDQAYALGANQKLKYEATLTGKITRVKTAYDAQYDNVTVIMVVEGRENKPITCYRMKGNGASKIDIGDIITVKGYIKNYVGDEGYSTVEFEYPTLVSYKKNTNVAPSDPVKIVEQAYALKAGETLPYKATLTGVISRVKTPYDAGYKNVTVIINVPGTTDMPITCYRMKGDGANKIAVGDTITVSGYIIKYQHSSGDTEVEFEAGCSLDSWTAGSDRPEVPDTPATPAVPYVEQIATGTAYKLGMYQADASQKKNYYFNGALDRNYLDTTANGSEAVDVYLESAGSGKYNLYFMNGNVKTYIAMEEYKDGNYYKAKAVLSTTAPSVYFTWNAALKTIVCNTGNDTFCFGTYGTWDTLSCTGSYYVTGDNAANVDVSQFIGRLYDPANIPENEDPTPDEPVPPVIDPDVPTVETELATAVTVGTAYKFGMNQVSKGAIYYFTGALESEKYLGTTENAAEAVDVFVEAVTGVDGAYYMYFMNGDVKTYITMAEYKDGNYYKAKAAVATTAPSIYYTWDDTLGTFICNTGNDIFCFGTYGTYTTIGCTSDYYFTGNNAGKVDTEQFIGRFYNVIAPETPDYSEQAAIMEQIKALEVGATLPNVTLTGEIVKINDAYSAQFQNITVTIQVFGTEDNLKCYRIKGDAASILAVGDTITVQGTVKNYQHQSSGDTELEFDAGSVIIQHIPATTPSPDPDPDPDTPVVPEVETELATAVTVGTAYKFGMNQVSKGAIYYFTGALESEKYLGTTENAAEAVDVFVEAVTGVDGAYYMYFMDGDVKTYITMTEYKDGNYYKAKAAVATTAPSIYYTWDDALGTFICNTGNDIFCFGTYGTYTTIGCTSDYYFTGNNAGKVDTEQFIGRFYTVVETEDDVLTVQEAIALGLSKEHNQYTEGKYYVTGVITEVYNTTFGNMKIKDEAGNILVIYGSYNADGTVGYSAMDVKPVAGDTVTIYGIVGRYNSDAQIKNGWITEFTHNEGGSDPEQPPVSGDPAADSTLTIAEAIALGQSKEKDNYTTGKYYVTGRVVQVDNAVYGNMYITDGTNYLLIYGTYDATGANRYDAMTEKPVAGDTVTLYGVIGMYNEAQMKNAWMTARTPGAGGSGSNTPAGVSITFNDLAKRTAVSTEQQVWVENGITVTNNKGASTTNVNAQYYNPARFYKNSTVIVEYAAGINQIVFDCGDATYATNLQNSITSGNVSVTLDKVTVTFDAPVTSFTVVLTANQVRMDGLTIS